MTTPVDLWTRGGRRRTLVGVVHLLPLPGAPSQSPGLSLVIRRAVADAQALAAGGADAAIIENIGDAPFFPDRVDPATIAAMTRVATEVAAEVPNLPLGVNVLRNDAIAAMAVAAATGAVFVRVNVLAGVMVSDQGILEGRARELALERNRLAARVRVAADVLVKHAQPLAPLSPEDAAVDLVSRAGADVLVVTGRGTGLRTDPDRLARVREAVAVPVWVGSGITAEDVAPARHADGAIVGTSLHQVGALTEPIAVSRVEAVRRALDALGVS